MQARTGPRSPNKKIYFRLSRHFFFICKVDTSLFKNIEPVGRLSIFLIVCKRNFQDAEHPHFFVAYGLQTLRIESMKPIDSPSAFTKNMDKVLPTGHQVQSIGLVPRTLLETCCKMDRLGFIVHSQLIEANFCCLL